MSTILITGGTGLVGSALTDLIIQRGHKVIILSRSPKQSHHQDISYATWSISKQSIDESAISKVDYIVHLAGAGVADKRWTDARKKEIRDSRTESSALIVEALKEIPNKVKAVVSASAIGWYGSDERLANNSTEFTEAMQADESFLGETCKAWEESITPIEALGKRLVKLRLGIVLSAKGGALKEFIKPIKFGVAAVLGDGKQVISWIHIEDLCRMFLQAIDDEQMKGVYNAVAPEPVTNQQLVVTLAKKLKGGFYIKAHVPAFVLKTMLGEMSIEVLKSAKVSAEKIKHAGFNFNYPTISAAVDALV
jgi:uncharacterized protein